LYTFFVHENWATPHHHHHFEKKIRPNVTNLFFIARKTDEQALNADGIIILDGFCSCALSRVDSKCKILSTLGFILEQQKLFASLHKIKLQYKLSLNYTLYLEELIL